VLKENFSDGILANLRRKEPSEELRNGKGKKKNKGETAREATRQKKREGFLPNSSERGLGKIKRKRKKNLRGGKKRRY